MVFHSTISLPKKVPVLKISEDVSACDLWFAPPPPPQSKILGTPMLSILFK